MQIKVLFEYVFLHCPNGVFDLEDKLLKVIMQYAVMRRFIALKNNEAII